MEAFKEISGGYMRRALSDIKGIVREAQDELSAVEYDTMVGTGLSGALVVPRLADALGKRWLIIRKDGDGSHSGKRAEGTMGTRWLFVDDFISTGDTLNNCLVAVAAIMLPFAEKPYFASPYWEPFTTEFVGSWCYEHGGYEPAGTRP